MSEVKLAQRQCIHGFAVMVPGRAANPPSVSIKARSDS
jgi:hypothetical protein